MPDFTTLSDEQVVNYLVEHYEDLGVGAPPPDTASRIFEGMELGETVIEKRNDAFAIVHKANRKYPGKAGQLGLIGYPPQADLAILFVAADARKNGVGRDLLEQVKERYMEDQCMELVCAGEARRTFFEDSGFVVRELTPQGFRMFCPARHRQ